MPGQGGDSQFLVVAQMNVGCLEERQHVLWDCASWGLPTHYNVKALASTADLNSPNEEDKPEWSRIGEPLSYTALSRAGTRSARPLHDVSAKWLETTFPKVVWSVEI